MENIMKNNMKNQEIKMRVEYLNALRMPVVVTKKVQKDKLPEFLASNTSRIIGGYENVYRMNWGSHDKGFRDTSEAFGIVSISLWYFLISYSN